MRGSFWVSLGMVGVIALAIATGSIAGRPPLASRSLQSGSNAISAIEASAHVRESTSVQGIVNEVFTSRGGTTFVDVDGFYPDQPFKAVVFPDDASAVGDLHAFEGRSVMISGTIMLYKGEPEIIVTSRDQIQLAQ